MYIAKHDCTLSTPTLWYLTMQALFAVFASEEVYLRDLDTLVDHYMCDSGLDPSLPKEQRVLSSQAYHHIFSNIKEIAYTSRGYCWHVVHLHVWGSVRYTASPSQLAMEHRNTPVYKYIDKISSECDCTYSGCWRSYSTDKRKVFLLILYLTFYCSV